MFTAGSERSAVCRARHLVIAMRSHQRQTQVRYRIAFASQIACFTEEFVNKSGAVSTPAKSWKHAAFWVGPDFSPAGRRLARAERDSASNNSRTERGEQRDAWSLPARPA